jgi:ACT domain-containing protein
MKQFDFFCVVSVPQESKFKIINQGRPKSITPEIVFETKKLLSSKNISNDVIIQKLNLSKSIFYRIKKGCYDDLSKKYLQSNIKNFSLTQEDALKH